MNKTALATGLVALLTASIAQTEDPVQADELLPEPEITFTGGGVYNFNEDVTSSTFDLVIKRIPIGPRAPVLGYPNLDLEAHSQQIVYSSISPETDISVELVGRFSLFSHYSEPYNNSIRSNKDDNFIETGPSIHLLRPYGKDYVSLFGGGFIRFGSNGKSTNGKKRYHHVLLGVEGNSDSIFFNGGYNALLQIDETFAVGAYIGGSTPTLKADSKGFLRDNEFAGSFKISPRVDIGNFTIQPKFELDGFSNYAYRHGSLPVEVGLSVGGVF